MLSNSLNSPLPWKFSYPTLISLLPHASSPTLNSLVPQFIMGRRKKSQASKLTSGQYDDPHDNLSEIRKALVENAALQAQLKKELCLLRASEPETKSPNPTVVAGSSKRRPSAQGSLNMLPASYVLDSCPSECGKSVASMKQPKQAEQTKSESVASMKQPKQAEETKCESVASMKQPKQAEETKCEGTVKKRCKPIAKQSWKPPITGMPFWLQAPLPETELLPRRK